MHCLFPSRAVIWLGVQDLRWAVQNMDLLGHLWEASKIRLINTIFFIIMSEVDTLFRTRHLLWIYHYFLGGLSWTQTCPCLVAFSMRPSRAPGQLPSIAALLVQALGISLFPHPPPPRGRDGVARTWDVPEERRILLFFSGNHLLLPSGHHIQTSVIDASGTAIDI
jgi:hypothetical protein